MVILSYQDLLSDQNNSIDVMLPQQKIINKEQCHASVFPFHLDLKFTFTFSHLADAFIQSDLQLV